MGKRDGYAFQLLAKRYFEQELGVVLFQEQKIDLKGGETHRFDLADEGAGVLIECKSYTFTASGNEPAAKLQNAKTDARLLKESSAIRKIIVFDDDVHPKKGSLARLFQRRNRLWLAEVEVWRCWKGEFEHVGPK